MLESLIQTEVFAFLLCSVRLMTFLSLLPAFGEQIISARIRLYVALLISLLLAPIVAEYIPPRPESFLALTLLIGHEIIIGFFMGIAFKMLIGMLQVAGEFISFLVGLSTIQSFAPSLGTQGSPHTVILTLVATVIIFELGIHFLFLEVFIVSYQLLPVDGPLMWQDMATKIVDIAALIFKAALQISGVFFVIILPANLFVGVVSRFMPAIQAFLVLLPGQILLGIWLFAISVPAMMYVFQIHLYNLIEFFLGKA